jgi:hypothetical protein
VVGARHRNEIRKDSDGLAHVRCPTYTQTVQSAQIIAPNASKDRVTRPLTQAGTADVIGAPGCSLGHDPARSAFAAIVGAAVASHSAATGRRASSIATRACGTTGTARPARECPATTTGRASTARARAAACRTTAARRGAARRRAAACRRAARAGGAAQIGRAGGPVDASGRGARAAASEVTAGVTSAAIRAAQRQRRLRIDATRRVTFQRRTARALGSLARDGRGEAQRAAYRKPMNVPRHHLATL